MNDNRGKWINSDRKYCRNNLSSDLDDGRCNRMMAVKVPNRISALPALVRQNEHEAAPLSLPPSTSPLSSQHDPCPRLSPPLPLHLPTFNRLSMPLWRHMKRRRNANFSHIPLPPSYRPATPPPPSYQSFKTSSSNLIAVVPAMRDYQIGWTPQSMCSTRSPPLLVKVLASLVPIDILPRICNLILVFKIWSPANVVFSGIGVLLLVSIVLDLPVSAIMTLGVS